jgi:hypothetical protein
MGSLRRAVLLLAWSLALAASLLAGSAVAGPTGPSAQTPALTPVDATRAEPKLSVVTIGMYVNQIPTMSVKENRFQADFYVWFRWAGDLKPYESFELTNGRIESRQVVLKELKTGEHYAVLRCTATIVKFWDLRRFPFDDHRLSLEIEDNANEDHLIRYVADAENSAISPELQLPGWLPSGAAASVDAHVYKTNYGDLTLPKGAESRYSRFSFAFDAKRFGLGPFFKLFFALWVAVLIAMLSLFIMPSEAGPRLGFNVGAIFASVGASYGIANNLPPTAFLTTAEKVNVLTVASVFVTLACSVYSVQRCKRTGDVAWSVRFDRVVLAVLAGAYLIGNLLLA